MKSLERILIIGPVFPYKSGIAHYTGLLYQELNKHFDTYMMSYRFQYPKFLYQKEQRDYSECTFEVKNTDYQIHTINPINWIQTALKIRKRNPDLLIMEWWHPYFAPCYFAILKMLNKKIKVLFLCHNVFPHERFFGDRWITRLTLKEGNMFLVQSSEDEKDLESIVQSPVVKRVVHPTYDAFKLKQITKQIARKMLGETEHTKLLLFFGFVRDYKGLQYLIQALPQVIAVYPECKLIIAGEFGTKKEKYYNLIQENKMEDHILIHDKYVPDSKVEPYFMASNVVVLPYESATQSGIVQIAYGFEKPVIVTNVGGLPEVVTEGETGYIVPARDSSALAQAIIQYFDKNMEETMSEQVRREACRFSWEQISEAIDKLWGCMCE